MPEILMLFLQGTPGPPGDPGLTVSSTSLHPPVLFLLGSHGFAMHSLRMKEHHVLMLPGNGGLWLPMGAKERGVGRERGTFPLERMDAL